MILCQGRYLTTRRHASNEWIVCPQHGGKISPALQIKTAMNKRKRKEKKNTGEEKARKIVSLRNHDHQTEGVTSKRPAFRVAWQTYISAIYPAFRIVLKVYILLKITVIFRPCFCFVRAIYSVLWFSESVRGTCLFIKLLFCGKIPLKQAWGILEYRRPLQDFNKAPSWYMILGIK